MGSVAGHREQMFNVGEADDSGADAEPVSAYSQPLPPQLSAQPTAIVGVAGIYDLRRLLETHRNISAYSDFIEGAFGADALLWDAVSPAQMVGSRGVEGGWKTGRLAVLAHSTDDELVDKGQLEAMRESLTGWEETKAQVPKQELTHKNRRVRVLSIGGAHDDAWTDGRELARSVKFAFEELHDMGLAPGSG